MEIQEIHRDHYNELINDLKAIHTIKNYFIADVLDDWLTDINTSLPEENIDEFYRSHENYQQFLQETMDHDQEIISKIATFFNQHEFQILKDLYDAAPGKYRPINFGTDSNAIIPVEILEYINDFSEDYYHSEIGDFTEELA